MKTYIITGAGHFPGLGSSTALKLLQRGNNVAINSRSFDSQWTDLAKQYDQQLLIVAGDIADQSVQQQLIQQTVNRWGGINGLVNNASTGKAEYENGRFTDQCWQDNFMVNVVAAYNLSESASPYLKKCRGSIVNVSSRAALQPGCGNNMAYALSKAALNHLTRNQALMYAPEVTANAVCPSWLVSQRLQNILGDRFESTAEAWRQKVLIQELIDPDQVANSILHLLDSHQINGHILSIDGGAVIQPGL
jgi:ketoreductase RED2